MRRPHGVSRAVAPRARPVAGHDVAHRSEPSLPRWAPRSATLGYWRGRPASRRVTVVVLSAIVPTAIAQRWFSPVPAPRDRRHVAPPEPSEALVGGDAP